MTLFLKPRPLRAASTPAGSCPCDNMLVAMIEGQLLGEEHDAVHHHLEECQACATLMVEIAHLLAPALPQLGRRYTLRGVIGQGATSVVHRGWDATLRREVAIKRARLCGVDDAMRAMLHHRFAVEAALLAQVHHPSVVRLLDVCSSPAGESCLVLELIEGQTMASWLAEEPREWRAILALHLDAARGLHALHSAGIVHRDFKPENLLVSAQGIKIIDLGLASTLDNASERVGTPCYMAPEQHDARRVGPAADQFAFCATLWEALTGQRPFVGRTADALRDAACAGVVDAAPAHLPALLMEALRRGLAARAEERWPCMTSLCEALEQACAPLRAA
jgi:eukaryotic-like serine/threonine-protein kinase